MVKVTCHFPPSSLFVITILNELLSAVDIITEKNSRFTFKYLWPHYRYNNSYGYILTRTFNAKISRTKM